MFVFKWLFYIIISPFWLIFILVKKVFVALKSKRAFLALKNFQLSAIDSLNGYEFEKYVACIFEALGYGVLLTNKSGDFGADIIAESKDEKIVVQTKLFYQKTVGNSAVQECYSAKGYYDAKHGVVVTNSTFSKSAVMTAEKLKIGLVDRTRLQQILSGSRRDAEHMLDDLILKTGEEK